MDSASPRYGPWHAGLCHGDKTRYRQQRSLILVCGRPGDRGGSPGRRHRDTRGLGVKAQSAKGVTWGKDRHGTLEAWAIRSRSLLRKGIEFSKLCRSRNYLFGVSKNSQLPFLASFLVCRAQSRSHNTPFACYLRYGS
jgi:hypothetical protein